MGLPDILLRRGVGCYDDAPRFAALPRSSGVERNEFRSKALLHRVQCSLPRMLARLCRWERAALAEPVSANPKNRTRNDSAAPKI